MWRDRAPDRDRCGTGRSGRREVTVVRRSDVADLNGTDEDRQPSGPPCPRCATIHRATLRSQQANRPGIWARLAARLTPTHSRRPHTAQPEAVQSESVPVPVTVIAPEPVHHRGRTHHLDTPTTAQLTPVLPRNRPVQRLTHRAARPTTGIGPGQTTTTSRPETIPRTGAGISGNTITSRIPPVLHSRGRLVIGDMNDWAARKPELSPIP